MGVRDKKQPEGVSNAADTQAASLPLTSSMLEDVFEAMHVMFAYLDRDFNFVRVNRSYAAVEGKQPADFIGRNHFELYPDADNEAIFRRVRDSGIPHSVAAKPFEYLHHPERGITHWDWSLKPVKDEAGQVTGLLLSLQDVTARIQMLEALEASHDTLHTIIETVPMRVFWKDRALNYLGCNSAFASDAGFSRPEELVGRDDFQMAWREQAELYRADDRQVIDSGAAKLNYEELQTTPQGNRIWLRTSKVPLRSRDDEVIGMLGIYEDITDRKRAELQLVHSEAQFRAIFDASPVPLALNDDRQNITLVNRAFVQTFGYRQADIPTLAEWWPKAYPHEDYRQWVEATWQEHFEKAKRENVPFEPLELRVCCKNGEFRTVMASASSLGESFAGSHLVIFYDITELKAAERQISTLAFYDPLTRLPNRRLLMDRLQRALAVSERNKSCGAILFIDLDNFKILNDTRGHSVGDLLLIEVATRLLGSVREGDTVARLGGDEFVVMLEGLHQEHSRAAAQARIVGEKILETLNQPYQLQGGEHKSSSSIGINVFYGQEEKLEDLLRRADAAMYEAKKAGRNTLRFFDPEMQRELERRVTLESWMQQALRNREFQLFYQIQVDGERRPIGAETLLRWVHPVQGPIPPNQFIYIAEETGLILPIGQWVLEAACLQLKEWEGHAALKTISLSVNISARQFRQADFVEQVIATVQAAGVDPARLKLELTESLVVQNLQDVGAKMSALKDFGISFSMDDFGTGHSSLSYLQRLPLDQLKIDGSFVRDVPGNPSDSAIVQTIISIGRTLGLEVIAEGVESEEQLDFLKQNGCFAYQGYLFGKPIPADQFERHLDSET